MASTTPDMTKQLAALEKQLKQSADEANTGPGCVFINTGGTLTMAAPSTYFGGTTITAGTLHVGTPFSPGMLTLAGGALSSAALTLSNHYTLSQDSSIAGAKNSILTMNGMGNLNAHTLTIISSGVVTLNGNVSGTGGITMNNPEGTLVLQGRSNYSGDTIIRAGTISTSSNALKYLNGNLSVSAGANLKVTDLSESLVVTYVGPYNTTFAALKQVLEQSFADATNAAKNKPVK